MLAGQAGSSPNEIRTRAAMQVFNQHPGIKILDTVYSDWSPVKGKQVMQAAISKYGKQINAVWSAHGLQTPGFDRGLHRGGLEGRRDSAAHDVRRQRSAAARAPAQGADARSRLPPAMGGVGIDVALKVLDGQTVPCTYEINSQIATTDGDETASIRRDLPISEVVVPNGPADMLVTGGMGPDYNPTTYSVDYPR